MRARSLNRRIRFEAEVDKKTASGQVKGEWTAFGPDVWCSYQPRRGREQYTADQRYAEVECQFRIRFLEGLTPKHRAIFEGRTYDIIAVLELGRRDGFIVLAESRSD